MSADLMSQIAGIVASRRLASLRTGTVAQGESGGLTVTQGGSEILVSGWLDGVRVAAGDTVLVAMSEAPEAQAAAVVLGKLSGTVLNRADEGTVTAVSTSARTVTVTAGGSTLTGVRYVGAAPAVGDVVLLDYRTSGVYALGAVIPAVPPEIVKAPTPPPRLPRRRPSHSPARSRSRRPGPAAGTTNTRCGPDTTA